MQNESKCSLLNSSYKINFNSTTEDELGELDDKIAVIQAGILSLLFLIAAIGNGTLISLYGRDHRMRTATNRLVISHIASEFAASVVGILMYVSVLAQSGKQNSHLYSQNLCIFVGSINIFFFCGSFLSLTSICVDRYMAVVKGIHHRLTHTRAQVALCIVWTQSLINSVPWDLAANKLPERYLAWLLSNCRYEYPKSVEPTSLVIYHSISAVFTICVPTIIMLYTCFHILRAAIRSRNQVHVIRTFTYRIAAAYSRSAFTTIIIITVYFLCMIPSAALYVCLKDDACHFHQSNYIAAKVAISFRSACYPIIYAMRNEKFVRYVRKLLTKRSKLPCGHACIATPQFSPNNECQVLRTPKQRTRKTISQTCTQSMSAKGQHPKLWNGFRKLAFVDLQELPEN